MDIEERIELITRPPTEEVITIEELRKLLETKEYPVAYNGWEPSGLVHLGTGLICGYKMIDFVKARVKFKAYLATWHALINNKLGGDEELIKKAAIHFIKTWEALGVPVNEIEFVWPDKLYDNIDYWNKVIRISKELTISRARRTLEIMGRKDIEARKVSDLIYTPMQVADIFQMEVDICQLGMDQRKANIVAREVGKKLGFWKPVCVHHHILKGLLAPPKWPLPENEKERKELLVSIKMSKSKPHGAIFVYDSPEEIRKKVELAFAPPKEVNYNPILDIVKYIVFREKKEFLISRSSKYGGDIMYTSYEDLEKDYKEGKLHPADLKNAVSEFLIDLLSPVRSYFERNPEAKELLSTLRNFSYSPE